MERNRLSIEQIINQANKKMLRKYLLCWIFAVLLFGLCLIASQKTAEFGNWMSQAFPSLKKIAQHPSNTSQLNVSYWATLLVAIPFFSIWLTCGENVRLRWKIGGIHSGRSGGERFFAMYFLAIPFALLFLFFIYFAPFEIPSQPQSGGQKIVFLMFHTHLGLLFFGSIAAMAAASLFMVILLCSWLMILWIIDVLRFEEINENASNTATKSPTKFHFSKTQDWRKNMINERISLAEAISKMPNHLDGISWILSLVVSLVLAVINIFSRNANPN